MPSQKDFLELIILVEDTNLVCKLECFLWGCLERKISKVLSLTLHIPILDQEKIT